MPTHLYKSLHSFHGGACRVSDVVRCRAGGCGGMAPVSAPHVPPPHVRGASLLAACALTVCLLLPGPAVRAAGSALGQDADAVDRIIRIGAELADVYSAGPVCERIDRDMDSVRGARLGSEAAMKRLLLVENDPKQEMLRSAFRRANESASRLEHTLDGTGAICRQGGDARIDSTGFRLRLENEALFMAENGRTLCRILRTEVPGLVWPDCDRP